MKLKHLILGSLAIFYQTLSVYAHQTITLNSKVKKLDLYVGFSNMRTYGGRAPTHQSSLLIYKANPNFSKLEWLHSVNNQFHKFPRIGRGFIRHLGNHLSGGEVGDFEGYHLNLQKLCHHRKAKKTNAIYLAFQADETMSLDDVGFFYIKAIPMYSKKEKNTLASIRFNFKKLKGHEDYPLLLTLIKNGSSCRWNLHAHKGLIENIEKVRTMGAAG